MSLVHHRDIFISQKEEKCQIFSARCNVFLFTERLDILLSGDISLFFYGLSSLYTNTSSPEVQFNVAIIKEIIINKIKINKWNKSCLKLIIYKHYWVRKEQVYISIGKKRQTIQISEGSYLRDGNLSFVLVSDVPVLVFSEIELWGGRKIMFVNLKVGRKHFIYWLTIERSKETAWQSFLFYIQCCQIFVS